MSFFSLPEYLGWKNEQPNINLWRIKYYKGVCFYIYHLVSVSGLGTSTAKEAKEYFSDMARHRIKFRYNGVGDDNSIELAFSKKKIEERKDWLTKWMEV